MQVSFASHLECGRATVAIGRVKATTRWRAADKAGTEAERQAAIDALKREAAEYGADAIVDVRFDLDDGLRWIRGCFERGWRRSTV